VQWTTAGTKLPDGCIPPPNTSRGGLQGEEAAELKDGLEPAFRTWCQCGHCQSGQLMRPARLLKATAAAGFPETDIDEG